MIRPPSARLVLGLVAATAACDEPANLGPFIPFAFGPAAAVSTERLCTNAANPDLDPDPLHPDCRLEGEDLAPDAGRTRSLRVLSYNVERGYELDGQLAWLASADGPRPDVVVLSEADRGCSRTGGRHVAREWAAALGMDYVYAVEFLEVTFDANGAVEEACEHGNAVLARVPIGNVRQIRFAQTDDWNATPDERTYPTGTRFGGRVAIRADLDLGGERVRLYAAHLASGPAEDALRTSAVEELLADAQDVRGPVVVTGDLNTYLYRLDLGLESEVESVTRTLRSAGFVDTHGALPLEARATDLEFDLVIDLVMVRGAAFESPWVADRAEVGTLSDHLPVGVTLRF